ncbi:MAG: hypothetical protein ABI811_05740 [Acidobacteriota bacterium]
MSRFLVRMATFVLLAPALYAVDLEIRFDALERLLGEQLFTADGRTYVRGSKAERCNYAFLEKPKLAASGDRVQLKVNFSGRTALDMFGRCVGVGDSFELTLSALPVVRNGVIGFDQVVVSTPRDSFYIRRVRTALAQTLNKDFKIDVVQQTKELIETPRQLGNYQQEIKDVHLSAIRVAPDSLVLGLDFRVIVK